MDPDWDKNPNANELTRGSLFFTSGVPVENLIVRLIDDKGNNKTDHNGSIAVLEFAKKAYP